VPEIRPITEADHPNVVAFLLESAPLYPGIEEWCRGKVLPDLLEGRRLGLMMEEAGSLAGLTIAKPGRRAKLCSIRVRDRYRNEGWGKHLLRSMAERLLHHGAQEIYVTVSEALEEAHRMFFEGLGFAQCGRLRDKYLKGTDELVYSWPMEAMAAFLRSPWLAARGARAKEQAGQGSDVPDLLMSLKPAYARLMLEGRKRVEFRRRFSRRHVGATVLFYVSGGTSRYEFTASISNVHCLPTNALWASFETEGGIDRQTFEAYFTGSGRGYAIELSDVRPLREQPHLNEVRTSCPQLMPPQSYKTLEHTDAFLQLWHDRLMQEGTRWQSVSCAVRK